MSILDTPGLWLIIARLAVLIFTGFIAWITYRSYLLLKELQPDGNLLLSLPETIARIVMAGLCLFLAWLSGLPAETLGLTVNNGWHSISLGLAVGIVTQITVYLITSHLIKHFGRRLYSPWLIRNILPRHPREWPLLALAFIPPITMEELLFRTLLIGLFWAIIPAWILILATSVVFGLMHQPQGQAGMALAGVINVFFCLVFIWTGELLVTFVAHYTVNMLQVMVAYFQRDWLEQY